MQIHSHFTANGIQLEPFPFKSERFMQAYLIENEGVLCLDNENFSEVEVLDVELYIKGGGSKNNNGRIDIVALYSQNCIAVIELKNIELTVVHFNQLMNYLRKKNELLDIYKNSLVADDYPEKIMGVLVGPSISEELRIKLYETNIANNEIPIAALTLQRFRSDGGSVYVTTNTYFNSINRNRLDYTKYKFNGNYYGKGQLALAIVKKYVEENPDTTLTALRRRFPENVVGSHGIAIEVEQAIKIATEVNDRRVKPRKRHFINPGQVIILKDCDAAVTNQWGANTARFIDYTKKELKYIIKEVSENS